MQGAPQFDRFWYLFMCAAGELRVRYVYLCVLVVGIVLITNGKEQRYYLLKQTICCYGENLKGKNAHSPTKL